jgi:dephospho-CoA kinase
VKAGPRAELLEDAAGVPAPAAITVPCVRRVLVTGMSGTGKSSALVELGRRGYRVVDTDSPLWSEWISAANDGRGEWLWREDRMAELLASSDGPTLYVSGCMSNQGTFYDRFEAVVLLSAPAEVILDRIETRTTNDYGKGPSERDLILSDLASVEPRLRATSRHEIDASRPLDDVVDELIAIGRSDFAERR